MRYVKRFGVVILSGISFVLIYMLLKSLRFPLRFDLWRRKEYIISLFNHKVEIFTLIHFILGCIFFVDGGVRLTEISEQVQVVRDKETRKPTKLLKSGYFAVLRHPMYGTFMILQLGIWFSIKSLIGIFILIPIIILFYANGILEENKSLKVIFGDEYISYMKKVPHRYLTKLMMFYFAAAVFFAIAGVIYM
ncbi:methyltransferase [Clostridium hydrogenum]|uniref:methyltransferase n=1 Tax=Clostridium hydrogenum TaxID=2855764 RepID=UPI001F40D071|nr:methyltransferase [Clostridium hydrogenum]